MSNSLLPNAERFFIEALERLRGLLESQREALDRAAALCTEAIARDGLVHLFGCGHSRMMCEEMTPRQGCFVGWHTIVELGLTYHNPIVGPNGLRQSLHLEKTAGYAEQILRNFAFGPHDVMIVISTSGIREVIVEMAEGSRLRGLKVIGVLSRAHCEQSAPAHPTGKKLLDVADIILDNGAPVGDCLLELQRLPPTPLPGSGKGAGGRGRHRTGPFSTLGGAMILNMLRCEVAQRLLDRGIEPVFLPSHQFVGSGTVEDDLEFFFAQYAKRLAPLYGRQA
jgi:uncharacterized phosphosugar-binding protein